MPTPTVVWELEISPSEFLHREWDGLNPVAELGKKSDGSVHWIVLAVAHDEFKALGVEKIRALGKEEHVLYDLKYLLPKKSVDMRL